MEEFRAGSGYPLTALLHIVPEEVRWTGNVIVENPVVASGIDVAPITRLVVTIRDALARANTASHVAPS